MKPLNSLAACFARPSEALWLRRFLPPVHSADLARWLRARLPARARLLDPFGAAPGLPAWLVGPGRPLTASAGNPVLHFLQTLAAHPPAGDDYRAALAALAAARKGNERLELHIRRQYYSRCHTCGRPVEAEAFLWRRQASAPHSLLYRCSHCGTHGEHPAREEDAARVQALEKLAPAYRARILQRVAPPQSPLRHAAADALEVYPPRALYVLATILNRFSVLSLPSTQQTALTALLLHAFDLGNALHRYPHPLERPRELITPAVFREANLWQALESALVPTMETAAQPPAGGLHLFPGPVRRLETDVPFQAGVGVIPRPNQAFWALSALWSGWLWGQQSARSYAFALERKHYRWRWYTEALHGAFTQVRARLEPSAPLLLAIPEAEDGLLRAVLIAADAAGFSLQAIALDEEADLAVAHWQRRTQPPDRLVLPAVPTLRHTDRETRALVNQPVSHRWRQTAILAVQSWRASLSGTKEKAAENYLRWTQLLQTGLPAIENEPPTATPLDEAIEKHLVSRLQRETLPPAQDELLHSLAPHFPGMQTPARSWVQAVLASYATRDERGWQLRPEDRAAARRKDLVEIAALLSALGKRLGYAVRREEKPHRRVWWGEERLFWLSASTVITALTLAASDGPAHYLVLPGGRSQLLWLRRRRNPWLDNRLRAWQVIKFRHVRRLAALPQLDRERLDEFLLRDPLQAETDQLPLL